MKMRILSMLLAFFMLFGMMPMAAFAEETAPIGEIVPVEETEPAQNTEPVTCSAFYVNPLYADSVDAEAMESAYYQNQVFNSGIEVAAEDTCYTTPAEAAAVLREAMENRNTTVVIPYEIPASYLEYEDGMLDLGMEIFDIAFAHTGVPTQGDYLKWHYQMWGVKANGYWNHEMTAVIADLTFTLSYHTDTAQEAAVTSRVDSLLAELNPTGTDYQKIKTVYDWMCDNIEYDYDNLNVPTYYLKYSAYAALINGTSVCQGYANLLYRLALEMSIDCRVITGYSANGSGEPEAHAWNIVKLGDYYYNLDATWDSSYAQVGMAYPYFLRSEASFENHYRNSDYTTSAFHAKYPMGESDFDPSQDVVEDDNIIASGTCGENLSWVLDIEGNLTISGTGAMENYREDYWQTDSPWYDYREVITNVVIENGVTTIGSYAFYECTNLANVTIGNGVTSIGTWAFSFCSSLTSLELPDCVTNIGGYAFSYCSSLTSITIPESVTDIQDCAFQECCSLTSVTIPEGITWIGKSLFYNCDSLTSITIPTSVEMICYSAFSSCDSLTSIVIPENMVIVENWAFAECTSLNEITFLGAAPEIDEEVFLEVTATAYYPANNPTWTANVMQNYGGEITWVPSCASHIWDTGTVTTEPTEESTGVRTYTCTLCGETKTETIPVLEHTHKYSASVTAPTCTEKGYTTYTCACGDTYVADEVPALDHDMGDWVITDATCTADGSKTRACARCDHTETEVIPATGHSHIPNVTAPTCITGGYTTYTCACGDTYVADEVPALDHDMGDWVITDATCIVDGSKTRACSRCDFAETEVITAPGHTHVPVVTAPTCTEKGYTTYTCACGDTYVADEVPALDHDHAYSLTAEPTEKGAGSLTGICTRCDDEVLVALPKLNKDDYTYEVELEPTEETEGTARYVWKNTDYGTYTFCVTLNKLGAANLGDVSGDGVINVLDLMYLANYFAKGETINKENADVNKDGSLDVRDLMFLANVFAGKETLK